MYYLFLSLAVFSSLDKIPQQGVCEPGPRDSELDSITPKGGGWEADILIFGLYFLHYKTVNDLKAVTRHRGEQILHFNHISKFVC